MDACVVRQLCKSLEGLYGTDHWQGVRRNFTGLLQRVAVVMGVGVDLGWGISK